MKCFPQQENIGSGDFLRFPFMGDGFMLSLLQNVMFLRLTPLRFRWGKIILQQGWKSFAW